MAGIALARPLPGFAARLCHHPSASRTCWTAARALPQHSPSLPAPRERNRVPSTTPAHRDTARGVPRTSSCSCRLRGTKEEPQADKIRQDSRLPITAPDSSSSRWVRDALGRQQLGHGCVQPHPSHTYLCAEVRGRAGQSSQARAELPGRAADQDEGLQKSWVLFFAIITEPVGSRVGAHTEPPTSIRH